MGAEYELKYRADAACQKAIAEAFPGTWEHLRMQTTYYDTPSGSLSARKYMLRRRLENGESVCTLKTPGAGNLRGEWNVSCARIEDAVCSLSRLDCPGEFSLLCKEGLLPICGARFTRQARLLEFPDFTAELALDSGVIFSGSKELPLCEIEIELKEGSKEALDAFAADFAAKYALAAEDKSKFARALALYKEV